MEFLHLDFTKCGDISPPFSEDPPDSALNICDSHVGGFYNDFVQEAREEDH